MKIWVTGASGFTGQHLLKQLCEVGDAEVVGVYRTAPVDPIDGVQIELIDLADANLLRERLESSSPDQIFHLAGQMPPATSSAMWDAFVRNTYHLLNAVRSSSAQKPVKMLVAGSAAEYLSNSTGVFSEDSAIGGVSDYGMSKSAQTMLCLNAAEQFGIDLVIARGFNFLGPGMSPNFVVGQICAQLAKGAEELVLGNLQSERDFLDIRDVASAYRTIMRSDAAGSVVNVCSGKATTIKEMVDIACEIYLVQPRIQSKARNHGFDIDRAIGDSTKLIETLRWQPAISLHQSISDVKKYG